MWRMESDDRSDMFGYGIVSYTRSRLLHDLFVLIILEKSNTLKCLNECDFHRGVLQMIQFVTIQCTL